MPLAVETKHVFIMEKCVIIKDMVECKPRLLVVDDEQEQCDSIKSYFSRRNFLVFSALTGEEALSLIKKHKPDLVLLDMKLPGMEGIEVLRILRQYDKDTKVAMVTGDILNDEEMKEITSLGIVDFLSKPVDFQTLEKLTKKALKDAYQGAVRFKAAKPQKDSIEAALRRISHDLSNITNDIANKCELYILDTEEGINENKTEKERLDEAVNIIKSVLKLSEGLTDLVRKLSSLAKKEL